MERTVSALLLAAGSSVRMGRTKQLLMLGEKPVINRCIDILLDAGIADIVIVISSCGNGLAGHLQGLPVSIIVNEDPGSDMAGSVRAGLRRPGNPSDAVLVCLSDHPLVTAETVGALIAGHDAHPGCIILPEYRGRRGHPTLFPRRILEEIFAGVTLRDIVRKDPERVSIVPVEDRGVVTDMDTPEDYQKILKQYRRKRGRSSEKQDDTR